MKASRIFDNGFGDKFEVTCEFTDWLSNPRWDFYVSKKTRGKRKFIRLVNEDSWECRNAKDRTAYRYREYLKEIPWAWIAMVMDDVCAEIRKLGNEIYPKDE